MDGALRLWIDGGTTNTRFTLTRGEEIAERICRRCPGLTQIWEQPFQALYQVADGEIVVRFREQGDAVEVAADLLKKAQ